MTEPPVAARGTPGEPDTRERLLDAAEVLFAERGIQGASVRAITARAGANLAAVHYHFGTKDAMAREVFLRRLRPINSERLRRLSEIEAASGQDTPAPDARAATRAPDASSPGDVEALVEALLAPALRRLYGASEGGRAFARLMGHTATQPDLPVHREVFEELRPVFERFAAAFERTLPHLPRREVLWRMFFSLGTIAHTLGAAGLGKHMTDGICDPTDPEGTIRRLVAFLAAGFRASDEETGTAEEAGGGGLGKVGARGTTPSTEGDEAVQADPSSEAAERAEALESVEPIGPGRPRDASP